MHTYMNDTHNHNKFILGGQKPNFGFVFSNVLVKLKTLLLHVFD